MIRVNIMERLKMKKAGSLAGATLLLAGWLLVGCSGAQPMAYQDQNEIPEGPGLFTGESGEVSFVLGDSAEEPTSAE
ncbi:MAG: hypothetical protein V7707_18375 [Motiliproteus sp.]